MTDQCSALGTLSRLLGVHPTTVKLTIDQLEAQGLVTRRPHPRDRRTTLVEITEVGLDRIRAANEALGVAEAGVLNAVAPHLRGMATALQPARLAVRDTGHLSELDLDPIRDLDQTTPDQTTPDQTTVPAVAPATTTRARATAATTAPARTTASKTTL